MRIFWNTLLAIALPILAHGADARSVLAASRQRIETADYRVVGHIVRIDAGGVRTNFSANVKAHWFPGVLRVLLDVTSPPPQRFRVLIELRPNGQVQMKIAHPGDKEFANLPFAQWAGGLFGPAFTIRGSARFTALLARSDNGKRKVRRARLRSALEQPRRGRSHPLCQSAHLARPHHRLPRSRRENPEGIQQCRRDRFPWAAARRRRLVRQPD